MRNKFPSLNTEGKTIIKHSGVFFATQIQARYQLYNAENAPV
jgi:hypothetical protein